MGDSLVFAARRPPWPLDNGGRIRSYHLLTGLVDAFETTLVTYEHHPESPDGSCPIEDLKEALQGIEVVTVAGLGPGRRRRQIAQLVAGRSWPWGAYARPEFGRALASVVEGRRADVVHYDDLGVAHFGPLGRPLDVYSAHNVEHRAVRQTAEVAKGPRRLHAAVDWHRQQAEEEKVWRRMPLCLAVSEVDAAVMRAAGAARVEVCPNGTNPVERLAAPRRGPGEALRLLFVGSGAYGPNERGLQWLIRHVLPALRLRLPAVLDVVGAPPRRPFEAEGVVYAGRVPSVRPWYDRSHVAVVPVFEGSGTRLKVLEAVAQGRPVVSTPLGVEGLPLQAGAHYLEGSDARGFVDALVQIGGWCAREGSPLDAMLAQARKAIEALLWPRIVSDLVDTYRTAVEGRPRLLDP